MVWSFDKFFQQQPIVTKELECFTFRDGPGLPQVGIVVADSHPLATTAIGGFQQNGIGNETVTQLQGVIDRFDRSVIVPGDGIDIGRNGQFLTLELITQLLNGMDRGSEKGHAHILNRLAKSSVLGKESVSGMHGLCPRHLYRMQHPVHIQIGFIGVGWTDADGFIRGTHKGRIGIGGTVDGNRSNVQGPAGTDHPFGNFPPIGNEYLIKEMRFRGGSDVRYSSSSS